MSRTLLSAFALTFGTALVLTAQTRVSPPANKYTPAQDVEMGLQAATEVRQQLPLMKDDAVTSYVERLGTRLTAVVPPELQHAEFKYTFEAVNVRDINAFALPGGPMFVNRGMIEAANSEGEVVGVMAHEVSHVLLRHGTAQGKSKQVFGSTLRRDCWPISVRWASARRIVSNEPMPSAWPRA